jgi:hypothetical protein
MTSVLKIHSVMGDDQVSWDPDVEDERMARAREEFTSARRREYFAYARLENGDTRVLHDFDPRAREILMAVPLMGG